MIPRLIIEEPARSDLAVAVRWYKKIRPGLETDFRLCVGATLHRIARHPESYPLVTSKLYRAFIDRFPFAVFYHSEGDAVHVHGVLHTSRSPKAWQARDH